MRCCRCGAPSEHGIILREGRVPANPDDPKTPDKSHMNVRGLCGQCWRLLGTFLTAPVEREATYAHT